MIAEFRVAKTRDGDLVRETHPDAAFLAYAKGDEVEAGHHAAYRKLVKDADSQPADAEQPGVEGSGLATPPAANKARTTSPNK